jgi:hypothetical protein
VRLEAAKGSVKAVEPDEKPARLAPGDRGIGSP